MKKKLIINIAQKILNGQIKKIKTSSKMWHVKRNGGSNIDIFFLLRIVDEEWVGFNINIFKNFIIKYNYLNN